MPRKRPSRSKKTPKNSQGEPMPCIPDSIDCGGPCAFTKEDAPKGEVTITVKTTTIKLNVLDILNGGKKPLADIAAGASGAVAKALEGVIGKYLSK